MLESNEQLRFTSAEIAEARRLGIDLAGVKTKAEYSNAVIELVTTLAHERPDLLERIAKKLCEETGSKMPAKLKLMP
jgi:hypothetical protein